VKEAPHEATSAQPLHAGNTSVTGDPETEPMGKRVIITGGSRGIGAAIARRLAARGARVAILDLREDLGRAVADELGGVFLPVDVRDVDGTRTATQRAVEELGGVDVLMNNAGVLRFASILDTDPREWDEVFAINTRPMLVTTQVVAAAMIAEGTRGTIVNMASMAGKTGGAGQGHYAASKAAVIALTRVTALELGVHGITANCICPGFVLTDMGAATRTDDDVAEWSKLSPLGRLADPDDVAGVAAFLASPDARYMTGQAVNVTGGMLMH
jgi:NAD(P)-dependent dehydrogenase (short-subunit alcohol dehydrogenase family)